MKVLHLSPNYVNPYVVELLASQSRIGIDASCSQKHFWLKKNEEFDAVHIHWPESIYGLEKANLSDFSYLFTDVLPFWKGESKIILTRHNETPHLDSDVTVRTYQEIENHLNGTIHLGAYSYKESRISLKNGLNEIIPHSCFSSYDLERPQAVARTNLKIKGDAFVVLAFGDIRNKKERIICTEAFCKLEAKKKILLAPRLYALARPSARDEPLEWAKWELKNKQKILPGRFRINGGWVSEDETADFFAAADIVLIPRTNTLNSGLLILAMQYGKVIVGPRCGNLAEILLDSKNPSYDPNCLSSLSEAMGRAKDMVAAGFGAENQKYAKAHWDPTEIAYKHLKFYRKVCGLE